MRTLHWHDGRQAAEEMRVININAYFAQEILLLLDEAGFRDVTIEGGYTGLPAKPDDGTVVFLARRPA
jgi:hypothetical protein